MQEIFTHKLEKPKTQSKVCLRLHAAGAASAEVILQPGGVSSMSIGSHAGGHQEASSCI
jgi:hypothetical protein